MIDESGSRRAVFLRAKEKKEEEWQSRKEELESIIASISDQELAARQLFHDEADDVSSVSGSARTSSQRGS